MSDPKIETDVRVVRVQIDPTCGAEEPCDPYVMVLTDDADGRIRREFLSQAVTALAGCPHAYPVDAPKETVMADGTFRCPICGHDEPHGHTDETVAAWRDDQVRADGWTSLSVRAPDTWAGPPRLLLVAGHTFTDKHWGFVSEHRPPEHNGKPEVVWHHSHYGFWLREQPWSGASGRRAQLYVVPTHWREVPEAPKCGGESASTG